MLRFVGFERAGDPWVMQEWECELLQRPGVYRGGQPARIVSPMSTSRIVTYRLSIPEARPLASVAGRGDGEQALTTLRRGVDEAPPPQ